MDFTQKIHKKISDLKAKNLFRSPVTVDSPVGARVTIDGREMLCFCSNDYLGLANDPEIKAAAIAAIEAWGVGAGASRLVSGTMSPHVQLERALSAFEGTEAAVVTSTGWQANHSAICALAGPGDLILCDKLNHASIIDAAAASGARLRTYHHTNVDRLTDVLKKHRDKYHQCLIVTDSLFSMDGDMAPLREIAALKRQYDAQLMIDEAHATGVFGPAGRGVAEFLAVEDDIDVKVGTLSKGLGTLGGFVAGPADLIALIRNTARPYVYTTAPPPAICAAAVKSLEIIRDQPARREKLLGMAEKFRKTLNSAGLDTLNSQSQIVPVIIGTAVEALTISEKLLAEGFLIPAIRPPTVAPGSSRLRISITASHAPEDVSRLAETLVKIVKT